MSTPVLGTTNLCLVLGRCQVVSTFTITITITMLYVRYSNRTIDAGAAALRAELKRPSQAPPPADLTSGGAADGH